MTDQEIKPYLGKPVRITLADGRIIAGTLHGDDDDGHGHGHAHYSVVSDPIVEGGQKIREAIHGSDQIVTVDDAANDPAAIE